MAGEDNFDVVKQRCDELRNAFGARNEINNKFTDIYLMKEPDGLPDDLDVKKTISPDGHNAIQAVVRLLASTSPKFSVPTDKTKPEDKERVDGLEKFANGVWYANNRVRQSPMEMDIVHSGALWAEFACGVELTDDLLEHAQGGSKAAVIRAERLQELTPVVFTGPWPINTVFPEYSDHGMVFFHRKLTVKAGVVLDAWGKLAIEAGVDESNRYADVDLCESLDDIVKGVWIDGESKPIFFGEHKLPRMNVVCNIVSGSRVHVKEEEKRHGFLHGLVKSGLHDRQTLAATVLYTNIFRHGINPQMVYKANSPENDIVIDKSMSGTIKIGVNESLEPLQQQAIDRFLLDAINMAEQKAEATTIFRQSMGGNIAGGNAPYSSIALLNQASRLPLVDIQKGCASGIGQMMEIAIDMVRERGSKATVQGEKGVVEIKSSDIKGPVLFDVILDVDLPQDQRQNAQTAAQLTEGDWPLTPDRWVHENLLGIGQSTEVMKEIGKEKIMKATILANVQAEIQKIMAKSQQALQPQQGQPIPQQSPEQMPQESAQSGLPLSAPIDLQAQGQVPPEQGML